MKRVSKWQALAVLCIGVFGGSLSIQAAAEEVSLFEQIPRSFVFSSGVGAWSTEISLEDDGTFDGFFYDWDMGDSAEGYSSGTCYQCAFDGKFSDPEQLDAYTWVMKLEYLNQDPAGEVFYDADARYITTDPYGFDDADQFYVYLPGKALEEMPEAFLVWAQIDRQTTDCMPEGQYGLYNAGGEMGFVGFEEILDPRLQALEEQDEQLQKMLADCTLQEEKEACSEQLYTLWDDELNLLWKEMKELLDVESMNLLTQEELQWIEQKESDAQQAADSVQPEEQRGTYLLRAYEWTRERVYYLMEVKEAYQ